jgi:hypothetical protein
MSAYIYVALGEASGLPVHATDTKYMMKTWLTTRRSIDHVRVFRLGGPKGTMEVCIPCFLKHPDAPLKRKGDH